MTSKEQLKQQIAAQFDGPKKKELDALDALMDGITEEQAAALLALDNYKIRYADGTTDAWSIGKILSFMIFISTTHATDGNESSLDSILHVVKGFAERSKREESDLHPTSDFWADLAQSMAGGEEAIIGKRADNYLLPTNKVQANVPEIPLNTRTGVNVGKGKKKAITDITLSVMDDENVSILGRTKPSKFDMAILNGVTSLIESGNAYITPDMAYRAMAGMTDNDLTPAQKKKAEQSIDKLRRTTIKINATAEAQQRGYEGEWIFESQILKADKVENRKINGQRVTAYVFDHDQQGAVKRPILYEYAKISKQILSVKTDILRLPVNTTERNIVLRDYLLRRINWIKGGNENKKVSYETIYKEVGIGESQNKTEKKRVRDATEAILGEWVRKGFITGYTTYKKGKTIAGVEIRAS